MPLILKVGTKLPIIKSAKKRVKTAKKATIRNAKTKRFLKGTIKTYNNKVSLDNLRDVQSAVDMAAKKRVIHKNKAARLKSRAAKLAKAAGVKPVKKTAVKPKPKTVKKAAPKAATKKPSKK